MDEHDSSAPTVFQTERLIAREFTLDDLQSVYEYASDIDNCAFMEWAPETLEGVRTYLESRLASQIADPRVTYDLALCKKDTGELIGSMGLYLEDDRRTGMMGWVLNKKFRHMGYALEAARGFIHFGFLGLDLHRIYAYCDTENTASYRLMERLGMRREAHFIKNRFAKVRSRASWRSTYHYAMLRKEYLCSLPDGCYDPASR